MVPYKMSGRIIPIYLAWNAQRAANMSHCLASEGLAATFTPQPLRAVRVLFSPMVSRWVGGKKFVWAVSQKLEGVES